MPRDIARAPELFVVAAEASADLHAAAFVEALRRRRPDVRISGIGGARLEALGMSLLEHNEQLAVMGFVEVLRHVPKHWRLLRRIDARLRAGAIDLVVLLDYPGFNMKVAALAHAAGVPVLYYITPQVWAWGRKRLPELARTVTRAACILPFEEALLRANGIDATFVGHPLLDRALALPSRTEARLQLGLPPERPCLAVFPGSRAQEIARHLPDAIAAAQLVRAERPDVHVVVAGAPTVTLRDDEVPFPIVRGASFPLLRAADAALCKSGTTTLEAAVAACPLVVVYRTHAITYAMARRVVRIPRIGLVNVVADAEVAPEFVQQAFTPRAVATALLPLLVDGSPERRTMLGGLARVRERLGTAGASDRVAAMADALLSDR
jgi:lipid-A-disaccharide synthase